MSNLYGGTLVISNGFNSTLNQFAKDMNRAGNQFKKFTNDNTNQANKAGRAWQDSFGKANKSFDKFFSNTTSKIGKITAGFLTIKGAISGVQKILESGMDFQNASVFLNAVYGDKVGAQKFKWATKEANNTPFSENEVANGLAKAHSLGLRDDEKTFKMYEDLGSYAKITGTGDLNSAIDAIADARSGEWERIFTITGAKRSQFEEFAKERGMGRFTNKDGKVTDPEKFMEVLKAYMDDKGITGMTDKFSKTLSGRLSTLKGNFGKMLAEVGGINDKGEVESGSLFDQAAKGLERLIEALGRFAKSESFNKIKNALGKLGQAIIDGLDYLSTHPEVVDKLLSLGKAFIGFKVVSTLLQPFKDFSGKLLDLLTMINDFKTGKGVFKAAKTASNFADDMVTPSSKGGIKNFGSSIAKTFKNIGSSIAKSKVGQTVKNFVGSIAKSKVGQTIKGLGSKIAKSGIGQAAKNAFGKIFKSSAAKGAAKGATKVAAKSGSKLLGSAAGPIGAGVAAGIEFGDTMYNDENSIRKWINSGIGKIKGEKHDYVGASFSNWAKGLLEFYHKIGFSPNNYTEEQYKNMRKNLSAYSQVKDDYLNGRTDSYVPFWDVLKDKGKTDLFPEVKINIEKVEKGADIDELMIKFSNMFNKVFSRNSVNG
ncbi:MAG: hypothetical protein E6240_01775 [Clostridium butyricum]|nr:hypothetical protein [Clostridium butyricum]